MLELKLPENSGGALASDMNLEGTNIYIFFKAQVLFRIPQYQILLVSYTKSIEPSSY